MVRTLKVGPRGLHRVRCSNENMAVSGNRKIQ